MNRSESIKNLAEALCKVQAEMPVVPFDSTNDFLKNRYSTLGKVIETSTPLLVKNGLSVAQLTVTQDGEIGVETALMHVSGEFISTTATLPIEPEKGKSIAQVAGSNISYLRRYALASILGIYSDEDTDGNGGGTARREAVKIEPKKQEASRPGNNHHLTIEEAYKVTNSKGEAYGTMSVTTLKKMLSALYKNLNGDTPPTNGEKEILLTKIAAAKTVLEEKESGGMN